MATVRLTDDRSGITTLIDSLRTSSEGVVVVRSDLVIHDASLTLLRTGAGSKALISNEPPYSIDVQQGLIVDAASDVHLVTSARVGSVGALFVAAEDATASGDALAKALDVIDREDWPTTDVFALVLVALIRYGIPISARAVGDLAWSRGDQSVMQSWTPQAVRSYQARTANRAHDGFYSTFVVRKLSKPLTALSVQLGLSPNVITIISLIIALASAVLFATGTYALIVIAAVALQLSLIVDCVDGEVARATGRFSKVGAWLDASTDRVKEFAVYIGLAIGAWRLGTDAWVLVAAMIALQTFRHMGDYDFQRAIDARTVAGQRRDFADVSPHESESGSLLAWSGQINQRPIIMWIKRIVHLPIGERWLILSVLAIIAGPTGALIGLAIAQVIALFYVMSSRIVRTVRWRAISPAVDVFERQADALVLGARLIRISGRWDWFTPGLLRLIELAVVTIVVWLQPQLGVVALLYMAVIAFHHYDVLYRTLLGAAFPAWLTRLGVGWDGRTLAIIVLAALAVLSNVMLILVVYTGVILVVMASIEWLRAMRKGA